MNLHDGFSKNTQTSNLMKMRVEEAELFHANGRTDGRTGRHDEANSRFSNFAHAPITQDINSMLSYVEQRADVGKLHYPTKNSLKTLNYRTRE